MRCVELVLGALNARSEAYEYACASRGDSSKAPRESCSIQAIRCGDADALCPTIQPFKLAHVAWLGLGHAQQLVFQERDAPGRTPALKSA